jgi:hypothetical protein
MHKCINCMMVRSLINFVHTSTWQRYRSEINHALIYVVVENLQLNNFFVNLAFKSTKNIEVKLTKIMIINALGEGNRLYIQYREDSVLNKPQFCRYTNWEEGGRIDRSNVEDYIVTNISTVKYSIK